eukprot:5349051-Prymnesium_polylepis.1
MYLVIPSGLTSSSGPAPPMSPMRVLLRCGELPILVASRSGKWCVCATSLLREQHLATAHPFLAEPLT